MFAKGDSIRFDSSGVTAKIVDICPDDGELDDRYQLEISPDDIEYLYGTGFLDVAKPPFRCSIPVTTPAILTKI